MRAPSAWRRRQIKNLKQGEAVWSTRKGAGRRPANEPQKKGGFATRDRPPEKKPVAGEAKTVAESP
jgi:hypothetical protein